MELEITFGMSQNCSDFQFSFIFTFQHVALDILQTGGSLFAVMIGERDNSDQEAEERDEKKNNDQL